MQDPSLHDEQLENEIKLVGELVLAASQHESAMGQAEIDEVLGLEQGEDEGAGALVVAEARAAASTDPAGAAER